MLHVIKATANDIFTFFKPTTKRGLIRFAILIICLGILMFFAFKGGSDDEISLPTARMVTLKTAGDFGSAANVSLIGSVEAINQARLQTETAGRVTHVNVALGDTVSSGAIIAQLENASQQAALLQAEGAYDAAVAAAATSDVGVSSAETSLQSAESAAITTYQSAYTNVASVVYSDIDQIYADPLDATPGVRINGGNKTAELNTTRVTLQTTLPAWQAKTVSISAQQNLDQALLEAETHTKTVIGLLDVIIDRLTIDQDEYANTEFATLRQTLITDRSTLTASMSALDNAQTNLTQARKQLDQATITGTNSSVSAANAQVKQALGALRAAQANYAKTIIRTPIAGVVNSVDVKTGDFVGLQTSVATIANNNALEITSFVGESDRALLYIGQAVLIENQYEGFITNIAPAVNETTKKVEIKIQTESAALANGDTVHLAIAPDAREQSDTSVSTILVPLTAVKFTATNGVLMTIVENHAVAVPVSVGPVIGSFVTITEGIDATTKFIVDARGISEGEELEVISAQ